MKKRYQSPVLTVAYLKDQFDLLCDSPHYDGEEVIFPSGGEEEGDF